MKLQAPVLILAAVHLIMWLAIGLWLIPLVTRLYEGLPLGNLPWLGRVILDAGWFGCTRFGLGGAVLVVTVGFFYQNRWLRAAVAIAVALLPLCAALALFLPLIGL